MANSKGIGMLVGIGALAFLLLRDPDIEIFQPSSNDVDYGRGTYRIEAWRTGGYFAKAWAGEESMNDETHYEYEDEAVAAAKAWLSP